MWLDGHLDLSYIADHGRDLRLAPEACGGTLQPAGVTFPSLRAGDVRAAVATIFVRRRRNVAADDGPWSFDTPEEAHAAVLRQLAMYRQWQAEGWLRIGSVEAPSANALGVVLALEGAEGLRSPADLAALAKAGVRMVSLAWAEGSRYAGGDQSGGDVTPAGRELIAEMDGLGVLHDVSHLSERAFWTLLSEARGPVVASHSNCRALLPGRKHPERHLSDDQIRALAAHRGGSGGAVIGINLFGRFLVPDAQHAGSGVRATLADVVQHVEHVTQIAGRRDCVALGSDADSGFGSILMPTGLERPEHWRRIADALSTAGWSDQAVDGFTHKNWLRALAAGASS
ncbi:MAG TPA: membrane dipeptidase [Phycisphaerae bacterium]|nr:membrane dipeptidase [Phycisphaerae bacterium]